MAGYVGRLAPSPTGALHLGNVRTFMVAWLRARSLGGRVVLRVEDLDHPKDKPGAAAQALADLRWLGFDWDEEHVQSARRGIYREALGILRREGLAYPCVCSRKDVESAQSAPHAGEQLFYPGTCRGRFAGWPEAQAALPAGRQPCWRFRVPDATSVAFDDAFAGRFEQDVSRTLGDFPLARDEGGAGYTLAAVTDDLLMGVTEVVRGDDLLAATPAQILVAEALAPRLVPGRAPAVRPLSYLHVPLVVGPDGRRLAKRHGDTRVAAYREGGVPAEAVLGFLAASCGWCAPGERVTLAELLPRFTLDTIPRAPFAVGPGALPAPGVRRLAASVYTAVRGYAWSSVPAGLDRARLDRLYRTAAEARGEFPAADRVDAGVVSDGDFVAAFSLRTVSGWDSEGRDAEYAAFAVLPAAEAAHVDFARLLADPFFSTPLRTPPEGLDYAGPESSVPPLTVAGRLLSGHAVEDFDLAGAGALVAAHGAKCGRWVFRSTGPGRATVSTGPWGLRKAD